MASMFNPMEYEPPSGIKLKVKGDRMRMVIRPSLLIRIITTVVFFLLISLPVVDKMFHLGLQEIQNPGIYLPAAGIASVIYAAFMLMRTVVELNPKELRVCHLPFRIPFSRTFKVKSINRPEIDTVERTHRDKHGNEHSTYTFKVQLALINDHWHPVIYSTGDETQADFIVGSLKWYLAKHQNYDPSRY